MLTVFVLISLFFTNIGAHDIDHTESCNKVFPNAIRQNTIENNPTKEDRVLENEKNEKSLINQPPENHKNNQINRWFLRRVITPDQTKSDPSPLSYFPQFSDLKDFLQNLRAKLHQLLEQHRIVFNSAEYQQFYNLLLNAQAQSSKLFSPSISHNLVEMLPKPEKAEHVVALIDFILKDVHGLEQPLKDRPFRHTNQLVQSVEQILNSSLQKRRDVNHIYNKLRTFINLYFSKHFKNPRSWTSLLLNQSKEVKRQIIEEIIVHYLIQRIVIISYQQIHKVNHLPVRDLYGPRAGLTRFSFLVSLQLVINYLALDLTLSEMKFYLNYYPNLNLLAAHPVRHELAELVENNEISDKAIEDFIAKHSFIITSDYGIQVARVVMNSLLFGSALFALLLLVL
ncbi:MAG: hypothetical protein NZ480_05490 [Bdellovibrionaceae bacterium]|nr:hypothetical protein [Pseudobdellovibrionaceae bacterium]MDW8190365.1 hypothetical protein [Pseudobdellovibrionaceae bacterium]